MQVVPSLVHMAQQRRQEEARQVEREQRRQSSSFESWNYNVFTKERTLPPAMLEASSAVKSLSETFDALVEARVALDSIPKALRFDPVITDNVPVNNPAHGHSAMIEKIDGWIEAREQHMQEMEVRLNALKLFWFPENVEQLFAGAYQSVRYPPQPIVPFAEDYACYICQEGFHLSGQNESDLSRPVTLTRRCHLNPLLKLPCEGHHCKCKHPPMCLRCALTHLLENCIFEGKSSVPCPGCRGEFCIYDLCE